MPLRRAAAILGGMTETAIHPSASFSATLRVHLDNHPGAFAELAGAIAAAGGLLGAIDLVRVEHGKKVRDVTVLAADDAHIERIVDAVRELDGVEVEHVSDRTFLLHLGGKLEIAPKAPLKTRDDLSMAYTPGVARVCSAIADAPEKVWNLTIKHNAVAVVSDGTAVLGLGESANPKTPYMPVWGQVISPTQVDDLVAYIHAGLPSVPTAQPVDVPTQQGLAVQGQALYTLYGCINCHGPNGLGGVPNPLSPDKTIPPLSGAAFFKQFNTDKKITDVIRSGSVIGKAPIVSMPHWGGIIPPARLQALVAYIKTLKTS